MPFERQYSGYNWEAEDAYFDRLDAVEARVLTLLPRQVQMCELAAVVAGVTREQRPAGFTAEVGRKAAEWIVAIYQDLIEHTDHAMACEVITAVCARQRIGLGGLITISRYPSHWYLWHQGPGGGSGTSVPITAGSSPT